ncbi:MAG TPA: hypothetical protein ENK15_07100 [Thermopetrobacter sp.]|nr:hypothetical protein [Thermopetrobacter sp.]
MTDDTNDTRAPDDLMRYELLMQTALRDVVRLALARVAANGLPGDHHFYVTIDTRHPGVRMPEALKARFPNELTIVLQHQFEDLEVQDVLFRVTLFFSGQPQRLQVPYAAIKAFYDPAVEFGLQFSAMAADDEANETQEEKAAEGEGAAAPHGSPASSEDQDNVVSLDVFRKK